MNLRRSAFILLSTAAACILGGCNAKDVDSFQDGKYDAIYIDRNPSGIGQEYAAADLKKESGTHFVVTLSTQTSKKNFNFNVDIAQGGIVLTLADASGLKLNLKSTKDQCLETDGKGPWARLCYDKTEISLDLKLSASDQGTTVILDLQNKKNLPPMENPADFTKDELVNRAINQSFISRLEFQKVIQSKLNARLMTENLIPHFSLNTYLQTATPSITSFLKVIGDLAPFLLPSKWARASEAKSEYDAELYGWITMKADSGNIVEDLIYTVLAEQEILVDLKKNEVSITAIRDQIKNRETTGILQIGTSDEITAVVNSIDQAITDEQDLLDVGYAALSQASGYYNPKAVRSVTLGSEPVTVDNPQTVDPDFISRLALERSYEWRQIDSLIQAAKSEKKGRYFNWLDPQGDNTGGIGIGYPTYIQIGTSKIETLVVQEQTIQSVVSEKVTEALSDMDLALKQKSEADDAKAIDNRRVARNINNMNLGISFALADLVTALQGQVKDDLLMISARYGYLIAWSKLNRLTYAGPYADLARGKLLSPAFDASLENADPAPGR